jgi:hypothetical protein
MNAIDPSNNYGGGKVKFFAGGSGGGGQTIQLLPLIIGSNNMTTASDGGMLPLNASYFIDGGRFPSVPYIDDVNATSYLANLNNPYYYYVSNGVIQALTPTNVNVEIDLYINGEIVVTRSLTLNSGNSYTSLFNFGQTPSLNQYPVSRYGIRVRQMGGVGMEFLVNTTNVFLSPYNINGNLESEFFTSSNVSQFEINAGERFYIGFGGQTNATIGEIPLVKSVVGSVVITEIRKVYFMLWETMDLNIDDFRIILFVDDVAVEEFNPTGVFNAYTPYTFDLTSPTIVTQNIYLELTSPSLETIKVYEVGISGYQLLD